MSLNGALAGLVAITAGCYTVTPMGSIFIGLIAGALVVLSVIFIDSVLKVDDPVGAVSVHGVCGAFGTLACGLFNAEAVLGIGDANSGLFYGGGFGQFGVQLAGCRSRFCLGIFPGSDSVQYHQGHCRYPRDCRRRTQGSGYYRTWYGSVQRIPDFYQSLMSPSRTVNNNTQAAANIAGLK